VCAAKLGGFNILQKKLATSNYLPPLEMLALQNFYSALNRIHLYDWMNLEGINIMPIF